MTNLVSCKRKGNSEGYAQDYQPRVMTKRMKEGRADR
jgi:hypothetical protein